MAGVRAGVDWPDALRMLGLRLGRAAVDEDEVVAPTAAARSNEAWETPDMGAVGWGCWRGVWLAEGLLMLRLEAVDEERC